MGRFFSRPRAQKRLRPNQSASLSRISAKPVFWRFGVISGAPKSPEIAFKREKRQKAQQIRQSHQHYSNRVLRRFAPISLAFRGDFQTLLGGFGGLSVLPGGIVETDAPAGAVVVQENNPGALQCRSDRREGCDQPRRAAIGIFDALDCCPRQPRALGQVARRPPKRAPRRPDLPCANHVV